jgi:type IV secretion system protein VirB10
MPATSPAPSILAPPNHEMTPAESPIFAFSGGSGAAEAAAAALPAPAALTTGNPANRPADPPSALANMLKPTVLSGSKAACCRIPT